MAEKKLKLICIGDGELFEEIKEMTNNLPCNTNVIFAGAQKVYPYLLKSKVFVLSSFMKEPISTSHELWTSCSCSQCRRYS